MNLGSYCAAAFPASGKSNKWKMMTFISRPLNADKLSLRLIKQISADKLIMRSVVIFTEMNHLTDIEPIGKHAADGIDMDHAAAFPMHPMICKHTRNAGK